MGGVWATVRGTKLSHDTSPAEGLPVLHGDRLVDHSQASNIRIDQTQVRNIWSSDRLQNGTVSRQRTFRGYITLSIFRERGDRRSALDAMDERGVGGDIEKYLLSPGAIAVEEAIDEVPSRALGGLGREPSHPMVERGKGRNESVLTEHHPRVGQTRPRKLVSSRCRHEAWKNKKKRTDGGDDNQRKDGRHGGERNSTRRRRS